MVWFRVDDGFPQSVKVLRIPRAERAAAVGLWTLAGAWSAGQLTDGFVPDYLLDELPAGRTHRGHLIDVGLWSPITHPITLDPGIQFHDWSDYQPSKEDVQVVRARHAANQKAYRERKRASRSDESVTDHAPGHKVTGDRVPAQPSPDPAQPSPDRSSYGTTSGLSVGKARAGARPTNPESSLTKRARAGADAVDQITKARSNGNPHQIGQ